MAGEHRFPIYKYQLHNFAVETGSRYFGKKGRSMDTTSAKNIYLLKLLLVAALSISLPSLISCKGPDKELNIPAEDTDLDEIPDDLLPPENFIPLNDEACAIENKSPEVIEKMEKKISSLLTKYNSSVAEGFEICNPNPGNGCPACATGENPMGDMAVRVDDLVALMMNAYGLNWGPEMTLTEYFRQALLYPYRYLVVSYSTNKKNDAQVILSQGKKQSCDGDPEDCNHFSIESESFETSCTYFSMDLQGTKTELSATESLISAELKEKWIDSVTFGFVVPLTDELPEDPFNLSENELELWIEKLANVEDRIDTKIEQPKVEITISSAENVCGTLSGTIDKQMFVDYANAEDLPVEFLDSILPDYASEADPNKIEVVLSFRLDPATFTSGIPCNAGGCVDVPDSSCDEDTLSAYVPDANCKLPRPAAFEDGDSIAPVCEYFDPLNYNVDCAAIGGECLVDDCTVSWNWPVPGDLVITEMMPRPETDKTYSDWFEFVNVSGVPLDISGCFLRGRDGMIGEKFTFSPDLPQIIAPDQAVVVAKSADSTLNGGIVDPDLVFGTSIMITGYDTGNTDYLSISCFNELIDEVSWGHDINGLVWGASLQLSSDKYDDSENDLPANWCNSAVSYGAGGLGSPKTENAVCP
jgi:hypothetical protein